MRSAAITICVILALLCVSQPQATIIHVPGDSSTIQGEINGAVNGDTLLVAQGTYCQHISFNGRAILVTSDAGAQTTIISELCDGFTKVTFSWGDDSESILDAFTIQSHQEGEETL